MLLIPSQVPDNGVNHLSDRLLLFRHDYNSNNILQMISAPTEITDETLVEIVLTANRKCAIFFEKLKFKYLYEKCFACTHSCRV